MTFFLGEMILTHVIWSLVNQLDRMDWLKMRKQNLFSHSDSMLAIEKKIVFRSSVLRIVGQSFIQGPANWIEWTDSKMKKPN
jgi:hypothetical protein